MNWENAVAKVSPYIVKIETPSGNGTGFLCFRRDKTWGGIATAHHVVADADKWQQPIKIYRNDFAKSTFITEKERYIWNAENLDSSVILFDPSKLELPETLIQLRPKEKPISIGSEVGWLGFPAIEPYTLCFFSGSISARRDDNSAYLIDGVAINGVSGGPVIYLDPTDGVQFVGAVSAYRINRQSGEALPGLLVAQDVSHANFVVEKIRSFEEEKQKKAAEEAKKKQQEANAKPPESSPSV
jgi:hypothetical protein